MRNFYELNQELDFEREFEMPIDLANSSFSRPQQPQKNPPSFALSVLFGEDVKNKISMLSQKGKQYGKMFCSRFACFREY